MWKNETKNYVDNKKMWKNETKKYVDNGGFDPPTSRMLSVRSTN